MTPEKYVQNAIVAYMSKLEQAGLPIWWERRQAGGFSYKKGIPDLYASYDGYHIEIEVKAPGKELRPMQMKFAKKCAQLHIRYICADSVALFKQQMKEWFNVEI